MVKTGEITGYEKFSKLFYKSAIKVKIICISNILIN